MPDGLVDRLTRTATRTALTGVTAGLGAWAATAGVRTMLRRRADEALQLAAQTPLGRLLPEPEVPADGAEDEAAVIAADAKAATAKAAAILRDADTPTEATKAAAPAAKTAPPAAKAAPPATKAASPAAAASPPDTIAPPTAEEIGMPGVSTAAAEEATAELLKEHAVPAEPKRGDLPIAGFDEASLASIRARLRNLSLENLVILREWELDHANRLPVVTMLDNRIVKVKAGD